MAAKKKTERKKTKVKTVVRWRYKDPIDHERHCELSSSIDELSRRLDRFEVVHNHLIGRLGSVKRADEILWAQGQLAEELAKIVDDIREQQQRLEARGDAMANDA